MSDNFDPEAMKRFVELIRNANVVLDEIVQGQIAEEQELDKNVKALMTFGRGVTRASKEFGTALTSASEGVGKYQGAVESLGDTAQAVGSQMGKMGMVVGTLVNIFSKLVGASLKQEQAIFNTYRGLTKIGDLGVEYRNIREEVAKAGFAIGENADKYVEAIKKVAPELASFSGTVTGGKKALTDVFYKTLGGAEKQLWRFGYSTEEAFEKTGSFLAQLAFSSKKQTLTTTQLNAMSVQYMETLAEVADLTGQSRDALEQQRQEQMNDLRWQMHLRNVEKKYGPAEAEREKNRRLMFEATYGKDMGKGYVSKVVNHGRTVDQAGANLVRMFGNQGWKSLRKGIYESGDEAVQFAEILDEVNPRVLKRIDSFGSTIAAGGNELGAEIGANADVLRGATKASGNAAKLQEIIDKKKNDAENQDIDAAYERNKKERAMRKTWEDFLEDLGRRASNVLTGFIDMVYAMTKRLAQLLKRVGGPDYTKYFRDSEDALEDMTDEMTKYKKTLADLRKVQDEKKKLGGDAYEAGRAKNVEIERLRQQAKSQAGKILDLEQERKSLPGGSRGQLNEKAMTDLAKVAGREGGQAAVESASSDATSGGAMTAGGASSNPFAGMSVKDGAHSPGAYVDPKLIELARKVSKLQGFNQFTSINDELHKNRDSKHKLGKAFDFTLGYKPDRNAGRQLVALLNGWGLKARDEYNFPSEGSTGGHIHAELKAAMGGYFNGPKSGYMVEHHDFEGVFNAKQMTALNNALTKTPISGGGSPTVQDTKFLDIMSQVVSVMEDMVDLQRRSNGTQEQILKHAKA